MNRTIEWEKPVIEFKVHELKTGDVFTCDNGNTWHTFERLGKSIIKDHVVIVTQDGKMLAKKPHDFVVIK